MSRFGNARKGLSRIALAGFVNGHLNKAESRGAHTVILKEGGKITPENIARAAQKRGITALIDGQKIHLAKQKAA